MPVSPKDSAKRKDMTPEQKTVIDRLMASALKSWDRELIQRCAETGADTQNLLTSAIAKRDAEMVKLALGYGADVNALVETAQGRRYQPVLHYAHDNFNEEVFTLILGRGVPIDLKNPAGDTVAQLAARSGDFERMRFYVERGADISANVQDIMFSAISKKNVEMVGWSLANGADVNALKRDSDGGMTTALHAVYSSFSEDIASLLIKKGLDVNARNSVGETVLHLCARDTQAEKMKFFLEKGADPLAVTYAGVSALDEAMKALEKANASARDSDWRYSSGSSSFNSTAQKAAQEKARGVLTQLLDRVKELYGREPYNVASKRDISISKPVTLTGKKPDGKTDVPPSTGP